MSHKIVSISLTDEIKQRMKYEADIKGITLSAFVKLIFEEYEQRRIEDD